MITKNAIINILCVVHTKVILDELCNTLIKKCNSEKLCKAFSTLCFNVAVMQYSVGVAVNLVELADTDAHKGYTARCVE